MGETQGSRSLGVSDLGRWSLVGVVWQGLMGRGFFYGWIVWFFFVLGVV